MHAASDDPLVVGDRRDSRETRGSCPGTGRRSSFMMFALWIAVTRLRPERARVLEREPRDPRRRLLGDDLQALDDAGTITCSSPA
jgi:hypothetical protein